MKAVADNFGLAIGKGRLDLRLLEKQPRKCLLPSNSEGFDNLERRIFLVCLHSCLCGRSVANLCQLCCLDVTSCPPRDVWDSVYSFLFAYI